MKTSTAFITTIFTVISSLGLAGCGQLNANSAVSSNVPNHDCKETAYEAHAKALTEANTTYDADMAACYDLANIGHTTVVSICLKNAAESRKTALSRAESALMINLANCEQVQEAF